ncbi:hypothetical protein DUNSADRAFT_10632 [Dunaliella salina]|uniref:Uncharacterized protein n=1 Tax=Dunaliella salina TaxID=3046 RepID=A0ABQ7FS78_DUNSA|nr:hypothetical protein DUNSADRAFT_10632 [Dunaliella salina]|eukprot:KAF5825395.1 hypothetical protein DUNSADRAFT_10632 [Dunaliella salina]
MEPLLLVVQALHGLLSSQAQAMRGLPDQLAPRLQQERADSVEAEVQQMKQLVSSLGRPEGAAMNFTPQKAERIELVIRRLRGLEQNVDHQAQLARAIDQATEDLDYSDQNYAYGSTPFCSWAKVRAVMHAPTMESMRIAPMEAFHFVAGPRCGQ